MHPGVSEPRSTRKQRAVVQTDVDVFLDLGIPVGIVGKALEEGDGAAARLGLRVAQLLAGVHDLLERAGEGNVSTNGKARGNAHHICFGNTYLKKSVRIFI